jgi:hypothetical protein
VTRGLTGATVTQITNPSLRPVMFYEGEFTTGTLRLWTGYGTKTWDSKTWTGAGTLMAVSPLEESTAVRAIGAQVSLSGMNSSVLSAVLQAARYGKPGRLWFGVLDAAGAVVADPYLAFVGKLDVPTVDDGGETCTITVSYESRLISMQRSLERRWSDADQQIDFPGDTGFRYVADLPDKTISWGGQNYNPAGALLSGRTGTTASNNTSSQTIGGGRGGNYIPVVQTR